MSVDPPPSINDVRPILRQVDLLLRALNRLDRVYRAGGATLDGAGVIRRLMHDLRAAVPGLTADTSKALVEIKKCAVRAVRVACTVDWADMPASETQATAEDSLPVPANRTVLGIAVGSGAVAVVAGLFILGKDDIAVDVFKWAIPVVLAVFAGTYFRADKRSPDPAEG